MTAPQPEQHIVIREKAKRAGGKIVFYGAEDHKATVLQPFIRWKLNRTPDLDGVVFFTFHQFRRGKKINFHLLRQLIDDGFEVHFAREDLTFLTVGDIEKSAALLLVLDFVARRDCSSEWQSFLFSWHL